MKHEPRHSFSRTPVTTQIVAYAVLLLEVVVFTVCVQNNVGSVLARAVLTSAYYVSWLGVVATGTVASCIDPTDALVKEKAKTAPLGKETLFCHICRSLVQEHTRHCKVCNMYLFPN
jgi:hypothetical protein